MKMISIEDLKRRIKEKFCNSCSTPYKDTDVIEMGEYCCDMVSDTMAFVDELPTVEAEPVKRGRWKLFDDGYVRCSECKHKAFIADDEAILTKRCHWCGAKMYSKLAEDNSECPEKAEASVNGNSFLMKRFMERS